MQYKNKPEIVEAVQAVESGVIATRYGATPISPKDWVVTDSYGEQHVFTAESFAKRFDLFSNKLEKIDLNKATGAEFIRVAVQVMTLALASTNRIAHGGHEITSQFLTGYQSGHTEGLGNIYKAARWHAEYVLNRPDISKTVMQRPADRAPEVISPQMPDARTLPKTAAEAPILNDEERSRMERDLANVNVPLV